MSEVSVSQSLAPAPPPGSFRASGIPQCWVLFGLAIRLAWSRVRGGSGRDARDAEAVSTALGRLKGPFAKVGQMLSLRVDLATPELREALAGLRSQVPPIGFASIRGALERELGKPLAEAFSYFEEAPIGAASIAQVHRARTTEGREVAVKVQYPWLEASLGADLAVLRALLSLTRFGTGSERERLFDEFARGVTNELDFEREAGAAEEIADNLREVADTRVPEILRSHSTRRVLTMSWHPTIPINDLETLRSRAIDPEEVLTTVAHAYARQIFVDGLFHADPHPGNLFVIDSEGLAEKPTVLFVDFGLCERLTPTLVHELRLGILALLQSDLEDFMAGMQRMEMIAPGAEVEVRAALEQMFARIRGGGSSALALSGDGVLGLKDEAKLLLYETPGLSLPTELLLYAKTISYLFALAGEIAPGLDLMKLLVPYLLRFLATKDPPQGRI